MGARALFLACLLTVSAFVAASEEAVSASEDSLVSDVLVLDVSNFTENVEKYDFLVVEFYAPWCGHCKRLAPEYESAATALKSNDPPIYLAKVDVNQEENKPLAAEFDVTGFPTLKIIRKMGEVVQDYKGPREYAGIVSYLKKLSGPPSLELTSAGQALEFFSENEELTIIGVFKTLDGEEYANFVKVADALRGDYLFAHTLDASFVPDNGVALKTPSIRLHKNFDDKIADHTDFSFDSLSAFIEAESLPLVTEMSKNPEHRPALIKFFGSTKDKVVLFLGNSEGEGEEGEGAADEEDSTSLLTFYLRDAKSFKEKGIIFLFAEFPESGSALQFFGLEASDLPAYVIQSANKKYILQNVDSKQLAPWLEDFLEGKLTAHIKSDPVPRTNDEPVKVVVAKSIKEVVLDSGKDVFLEFYAPWCGHCKKLAPILDEVAVSFESDPDIVIAKFDATSNDVPSDVFDVKGFPTLYFCSATGVITPFDGDRTAEGIIEFINENRSSGSQSGKEAVTEELVESVSQTWASKDEL